VLIIFDVMKKFFAIIILCVVSTEMFAWGAIGHRIVGLIAERHLTKKAKKNLNLILDNETLAEVGNYMDFIRSDNTYSHMTSWHYATIPDGQTYKEAGIPESGDVIQTINRLVSELSSKEFSDEDEAFALKCLVHLIGDIHQPLHVGNGTDKGGNDVKLEYFWNSSNLHRVWDSEIIDGQQYSYTEYVEWIDHASPSELEAWNSLEVLDWASESKTYRDQCYDTLPENMKLSYRYNFDNLELVNQRLLQAGLRLAGILNKIYG